MSHKSYVSAGVAILFPKSFIHLSYEVEVITERLIKATVKYERKTIFLLIFFWGKKKSSDTLARCESADFLSFF